MTSYKQLEVQFEEPNPKKWCVPLKEDVFVKFMNKGNFITHKALCEGSLFSPLLFGKFFDPSDAFPLWEFDSDVLLSNAKSSNNNQYKVDWIQTETDYVLKTEIPDPTCIGQFFCTSSINISATTYRMLLAVRTLYTRPCRLLNCPRGQFNGLQGNIPTTPLANVPRAVELQHVVVLLGGISRGRASGVGKGIICVSVEDGKVLEVSAQLRLKVETGTKDWRAGNWWEHGCVRRIELPENSDWKKTEALMSNGDHKFLEVKIPKIPPNICDVP